MEGGGGEEASDGDEEAGGGGGVVLVVDSVVHTFGWRLRIEFSTKDLRK